MGQVGQVQVRRMGGMHLRLDLLLDLLARTRWNGVSRHGGKGSAGGFKSRRRNAIGRMVSLRTARGEECEKQLCDLCVCVCVRV